MGSSRDREINGIRGNAEFDQGAPACAAQPVRTPLWTIKAYQYLGTAAWACSFRLIGVYYIHVGLHRTQIGYMSVSRRFASFVGGFFWAYLCDRLGEYKRVLVTSQCLCIASNLCLLLPVVQAHYGLVFSVIVFGSFVGSAASGGVIDALCYRVMAQHGSNETYGNQRLWSALAAAMLCLVVAALVDSLGISVMFLGYGIFASANVLIMVMYLPPPDQTSARALRERLTHRTIPPSESGVCNNFEVIWLLTNLFVYGVCMSLVEGFFAVFLLQDFVSTPTVLVGAAATTMCMSEVPVFKWFHILSLGETPRFSLRSVLFACHAALALRCVLYAALPEQMPWMVLLVEPLHGITFAAMWNAAVETGKQLAAPGQEATMQVLITGCYNQLANGIGEVFWGHVVEPSPHGLGFRRAFLLDACAVLAWSGLWAGGWRWHRRRTVPSSA